MLNQKLIEQNEDFLKKRFSQVENSTRIIF